MNAVDKMMKKERIKKYKRIKTLHKCRDMASKYNKKFIPLSKVVKYFNRRFEFLPSNTFISKTIIDRENEILGILPKPPARKK